jgi:hypothetical protein
MNFHSNYTHSLALTERKFQRMSKRRRKRAKEFMLHMNFRPFDYLRIWAVDHAALVRAVSPP